MSTTGISKCAKPNCSQIWRRLGEGKLFTFYVRSSSSDSRSITYAWLCENCAESWEVTLHGSEIVVIPVYQKVS